MDYKPQILVDHKTNKPLIPDQKPNPFSIRRGPKDSPMQKVKWHRAIFFPTKIAICLCLRLLVGSVIVLYAIGS